MKPKKNRQREFDDEKGEQQQQVTGAPHTRSTQPKPKAQDQTQGTKSFDYDGSNFSNVKAQEKVPDEFYNPHFSQYLTETRLTPTTKRVPFLQKQVNTNVEDVTSRTLPPPNQPPLSVYMETTAKSKIGDVLSLLKDAKTIPVLDNIGPDSPQVFVGPSSLKPPHGYVKFELPYLSSLDGNKVEHKVLQLPFFVAPLNFQPPAGYSKIPFPPPHIGSVVLSNNAPKSFDEKDNFESHPPQYQPTTPPFSNAYTIPADISSISPQLPSLINNLQVDDDKYNALPTPQQIHPETTAAPVVNERPSHHTRRPHPTRGGQRNSNNYNNNNNDEGDASTTTRRPIRQRRPFTSRNSQRQTTTPLTTTTQSTTEAYHFSTKDEYNSDREEPKHRDNYVFQQNQDEFPSQSAGDSFRVSSYQDIHSGSHSTKNGFDNYQPSTPSYKEDEEANYNEQRTSNNQYKQGANRYTQPSFRHDDVKEVEVSNNGDSYTPDYSAISNRPSDVSSKEQVTTIQTPSETPISGGKANYNDERQGVPQTNTGFNNFNRDTQYYTPGQFDSSPNSYDEGIKEFPGKSEQQGSLFNTPEPNDYINNVRFPVTGYSNNDQQLLNKNVSPELRPNLVPHEQTPDEHPTRFSEGSPLPSHRDQEYFPQYKNVNSQSKKPVSGFFESSSEQQYEDYITTERHTKVLQQTTSQERDAVSQDQDKDKEAALSHSDENNFEKPKFRTRTHNIRTKVHTEAQPTTTPSYTPDTAPPSSTEKTRLRGRVRGRGSYTARVRTTTEPPNYPSISFEREQKKVTFNYNAARSEAPPASEQSTASEETAPPAETATRTPNNKYGQSRTVSRRPLRPSPHRVTSSASASTSVTSTAPPGVKYLIRTRRPTQNPQAKLSTGQNRIRRPTAPTTTSEAPSTESPKTYNTFYPSQPVEHDEENKLKYYTQPVLRISPTDSRDQFRTEGDTIDYKPLEGSFDPSENIKFVHNSKSSTPIYHSEENSNEFADLLTTKSSQQEPSHPVYSKPRPYLYSSKKSNHPLTALRSTEDSRMNLKVYDSSELTTRPYYDDVRETTRRAIVHTTPPYVQQEEIRDRPKYNQRKKVTTESAQEEEEEQATLRPHRRGQHHRSQLQVADSARFERPNNHRLNVDHQPRELTKSEKQKEAEDFWNQAVTIQQSKSYEYDPDSPIFSTPMPSSKSPKGSKNDFEYEDYFNEHGKFDKAVSDQSPLSSNDQQVTFTGLKPRGEVGKENQYAEKSTTTSYKGYVEPVSSVNEKDKIDAAGEEPSKIEDEGVAKMSSRSDTDLGTTGSVTQGTDFSPASEKVSSSYFLLYDKNLYGQNQVFH